LKGLHLRRTKGHRWTPSVPKLSKHAGKKRRRTSEASKKPTLPKRKDARERVFGILQRCHGTMTMKQNGILYRWDPGMEVHRVWEHRKQQPDLSLAIRGRERKVTTEEDQTNILPTNGSHQQSLREGRAYDAFRWRAKKKRRNWSLVLHR